MESKEMKLALAIAMAEKLLMKGLISNEEMAKIRLKLAENIK